jgi:hypothetical protein
MRKGIWLLGTVALACMLTACTMWPERKPQAWTDVTGGESLERAFWHDLKAKDWKDLESHIATTYLLVTSDGTFDKAAALERWQQLDIKDYSLGEFTVQLNGNAYVVSYTVTMRGTMGGKALPGAPLRAMTVWQQYARDWLALAHSATPAVSVPQNPR